MKSCLKIDKIVGQVVPACANTWDFFSLAELEEEGKQSINPKVRVQDVLATTRVMASFVT
jgi:hypothetical protein